MLYNQTYVFTLVTMVIKYLMNDVRKFGYCRH